jgi:hypothetical protein
MSSKLPKNTLDAFKKAWSEYPSQDNEGYLPDRGGFKCGWYAAIDWLISQGWNPPLKKKHCKKCGNHSSRSIYCSNACWVADEVEELDKEIKNKKPLGQNLVGALREVLNKEVVINKPKALCVICNHVIKHEILYCCCKCMTKHRKKK